MTGAAPMTTHDPISGISALYSPATRAMPTMRVPIVLQHEQRKQDIVPATQRR